MLPAEPPEIPQPFEACIADLDTIVAPNLSHWQHPRFFGYFPANALFAGVLGDLVSTGLGTVGLSWQSSPALSEVEEVVTDWVRKMVDLSPAWVGVISDTASTSTLVAMISARERTTDYGLAKGYAWSVEYTDDPHPRNTFWHAWRRGRASRRLRRDNVGRFHSTNPGHAAGRAERADRARPRGGTATCAVAACVGGTATASLDPIREIADIARATAWLPCRRGDGGVGDDPAGMPLDVEGIESADSVVINAHKWRRTVRLLALLRARRTAPVAGHVDQSKLSPIVGRQPGPQPARHRHPARPALPRAQALVPDPRAGGLRLQARLRRDIANASHLAGVVSATPGWKVVAPSTCKRCASGTSPAA